MPGNTASVGRDLVPDPQRLSLSQALSGDVFQVAALTDTFQEAISVAQIQASEMLDLIVQLDCICNEEWIYTIAPDLASAQASTSDKHFPVKPDVEKIIPLVRPEGRLFVKQASGGSGLPLAMSAWGYETPVNDQIANTP